MTECAGRRRAFACQADGRHACWQSCWQLAAAQSMRVPNDSARLSKSLRPPLTLTDAPSSLRVVRSYCVTQSV
eukprot:364976-Chlamydomonas_euryale.AAC.6